MLKTIYVTVGIPGRRSFLVNKSLCNVPLDKQTEIKIAKLVRKQMAEMQHTEDPKTGEVRKFRPSELYYAIFENPTDTIPTANSKNYPGDNHHGPL